MSKIGRKSIPLANTQVEIVNQEVRYSGKHDSGTYQLPYQFAAAMNDGMLSIKIKTEYSKQRSLNMAWGLHRALLANKIKGASELFVRQLEIVGLGFKAALAGNKVTFTLGFTEPINFELPKGVSLQIDKAGKILTFSSPSKELLGHVSSVVRMFRPPEPYKGTGIKYMDEVIKRKAGKAKASA